MIVIEWVDAWLAEHADEVRSHGVAVEVTRSPADRPKCAVVVRLESTEALGQLIVWESGEAMADFGRVGSETLLTQAMDVADAQGVDEALWTLVGQVGATTK